MFDDSMIRFLAKQLLVQISSKDLPMVCFVVTQHSESALSLCLRYSKTSCAATPEYLWASRSVPLINN